MTDIKKLQQNSKEFAPITVAEATVVNTNNLPGLSSLGITTLDKILYNIVGVVGTNSVNIKNLTDSKQDKLTAGDGIVINNNVISTTAKGGTLYTIVKALPTPSADLVNSLYLVPNQDEELTDNYVNIFSEYLCVESNGRYLWELVGSMSTNIDLTNYITKTEFYSVGVIAQNVTTSSGGAVSVNYSIPDTLYDSLTDTSNVTVN